MNKTIQFRLVHAIIIGIFSLFYIIFSSINFLFIILSLYYFYILPGLLVLSILFPDWLKNIRSIAFSPIISSIIILSYMIPMFFVFRVINREIILIITTIGNAILILFTIRLKKMNEILFSIKQPLKIGNIFKSNLFLLIIYLFLIGFFLSIRFLVTFSDDPWFHVIYAQKLLKNNIVIQDYRGLLSLFILIGHFNTITHIDFVLIIKWFPILTVPYGGVLLLMFSKKIYKKKGLSEVFITIISIVPIGYCLSINQLWPTALSALFGLAAFTLYLDLNDKSLNALQRINTKIFFLMILFLLIITHDISSLMIIMTFIFISLLKLYDVKQKKEKISIIIIPGIGLTSFLIYQLLFAPNFILNIVKMDNILKFIPIYTYPFIILFGIFLIKKLFHFVHKETDFPENSPSILYDKGNLWTNFITKNLVNTYFLSIITISSIILIFVQFVLEFSPSSFFSMIGMGINVAIMIVNFVVSMAIIRRMDNNHRDITRIGIFLFFVFVFLLLIDILIIKYYWWIRFLLLCAPYFGLISYKLFDFIQKDLVFTHKFKTILVILSIMSISSGLYYENTLSEYKTESELAFGEYFGEGSDSNGILFTGFRWKYHIQYYSENKEFIVETNELVNPKYHIDELSNYTYFKQVNESNNLYILLDEYQLERGIYGIDDKKYEEMNQTLQDEYYNLVYLNRICVTQKNMVYWYNGRR